jgi:hypothetical protein
MPNYIITEKQEILLKELYVAQGKFDVSPVLYFFREVVNNLVNKKYKKLIHVVRSFFRNELAMNIDKWDDVKIESYLRDIRLQNLHRYPNLLRKPSTVVSLSYHIMKNFLTVQQFEGLEYYKLVDNPYYRFFFFDPDVEELVGFMETKKSLSLPGKSVKVVLSAVEKEYVGRGYGSRMYLCVLNQVDYLMSDDTLYLDSLNMWVNYLPKKVNVWAVVNVEKDNSDYTEVVQLTSKNFKTPNDINKLIASSNKSNPPKFK